MLDRRCVRNVKPLTCRAKRAAIANAPNTPESIDRSLARPTIMDTATHPHERHDFAPAPARPRAASQPRDRAIEEVESVVIRFVGDSGDGMQLTGDEFSKSVARAGHDFATHPDYPSEIRAPTGTLFGVSGYQIQFSSGQVFTSGDAPDVLVAMNPAALKTNLADVKRGGMIIANSGAFTEANLDKAGYGATRSRTAASTASAPTRIDISGLTAEALEDTGLVEEGDRPLQELLRARPDALALQPPARKRRGRTSAPSSRASPEIAAANVAALRAGYAYGETTEMFVATYHVRAADIAPGRYRSLTGNHAAALGFVAASELSGVPLFLGSYPITPATDILHELSALKHYNVTTFQAEDEIAGICSAIGAVLRRRARHDHDVGPGHGAQDRSARPRRDAGAAAGDRQRAARRPVHRPADQDRAIRPAAGGLRPQRRVPGPGDRRPVAGRLLRLRDRGVPPRGEVHDAGDPAFRRRHRQCRRAVAHSRSGEPRATRSEFRTDPEGFQPYARDENLARAWVRPGTPGMEHRIGGLEKDFLTGDISHDPLNHQRMVEVRAAKVAGIARDIPPIAGRRAAAGRPARRRLGQHLRRRSSQAREQAAAAGKSVAHVHLRHLNPFPADSGRHPARYKTILVPELNLGQLSQLLRERYLRDVVPLSKVQGKPFKVSEIYDDHGTLLRSRP